MKTIEINLYKFDELSEQAKQRAIENERLNGIDTSFIYDEARNKVEWFCDIFNCFSDSRNWLEYNYFDAEHEEILSFTDERLRKFIINNFWHDLHIGKYYSLWSKKDQNPHYTPNGSAPWGKLKTRYSKNNIRAFMRFTGVCYDESILQPIYEFLDGKGYELYTIDELFTACFQKLSNDIDNQIEAMLSDEYISEQLQCNDYNFLESGEIY